MGNEKIYKVALDSLSAHVAILDQDGVIIESNRAWRDFALENGLTENPGSIGVNYLKVCEQAGPEAGAEPAAVAQGIRRVISGELTEVFIDYPCHAPRQQRWYALRVVRFREPGSRKVILAHENITPLVLVQRSLAQKESELRDKGDRLEESNIALKVLLRHREDDRRQLEENMVANVRELILPYVDRLLGAGLKAREQAVVEIIRDRLQEIISPFLNRLTSLNTLLTPQEIRVATLVREGRSSKDIAEILMVSVSAVDFHRKRIRKKLNMAGRGANLRSYLLSLH
ncbi:MAG: helix-turn-helix transcriptional regulator [Desulfobulbus sp.]|nr:MAG: helix-turn-helix transcriptional regulator [Desulfobulbus sp.]